MIAASSLGSFDPLRATSSHLERLTPPPQVSDFSRNPHPRAKRGHDSSLFRRVEDQERSVNGGFPPIPRKRVPRALAPSLSHSPSAALALHPILRLPFLGRLPLHVARRVGATTGERHDVIHHMAGPAMRVAAPSHEIVLRRLATVDSSGIASRAARSRARVRRVGPRFGHLAPRT